MQVLLCLLQGVHGAHEHRVDRLNRHRGRRGGGLLECGQIGADVLAKGGDELPHRPAILLVEREQRVALFAHVEATNDRRSSSTVLRHASAGEHASDGVEVLGRAIGADAGAPLARLGEAVAFLLQEELGYPLRLHVEEQRCEAAGKPERVGSTMERHGSIRGCPSLQMQAHIEWALRTERLREVKVIGTTDRTTRHRHGMDIRVWSTYDGNRYLTAFSSTWRSISAR